MNLTELIAHSLRTCPYNPILDCGPYCYVGEEAHIGPSCHPCSILCDGGTGDENECKNKCGGKSIPLLTNMQSN